MVEIQGRRGRNAMVSVAAMLIPTNDTFMALPSMRLPIAGSAEYLIFSSAAGLLSRWANREVNKVSQVQ